LGSPIRASFGGVLRNDAGYYFKDFSGYIQNFSNILYAELYDIYHGLLLAKSMGIIEPVFYSDSLHGINIVKDPSLKYHFYAVLIQDIKYLIEQGNVSIIHTLHEWNQCANFMVKLDVSSNFEFFRQYSPPIDLLSLLRSDAARTFYLRD